MTGFGVYDDEMPNDAPTFDDALVEAFLSGRATRADEIGPLAVFAQDLGVALNGPAPVASPDLAKVLRSGIAGVPGCPAARPAMATGMVASPALGPAVRSSRWRNARLSVAQRLSGVVAEVAVGAALVVGGIVGAGAAGALPASAEHAVATVIGTVTHVELRDPDGGHAKVPTAPKAPAESKSGATPPSSNAGGAATGLNRANETPAAGDAPTSVPGANTGGAATGQDRAAQTPAAQTPAATQGPTSTPAATSGGAVTGQDRAAQTPAAQTPAAQTRAATHGPTSTPAATSGGAVTGQDRVSQTPAAAHAATTVAHK